MAEIKSANRDRPDMIFPIMPKSMLWYKGNHSATAIFSVSQMDCKTYMEGVSYVK